MTSDELAATFRFMTDAGHLLAAAAPETSAYLMRRRNELMFEHEMAPTDKQRQQVCNCCGHIMLLGQDSSFHVKAAKRASKKLRSTQRPHGKVAQSVGLQTGSGPAKFITCGYCGKFTEVKVPAPAAISRHKMKVEKTTKASGPAMAPSLSNTVPETPSQKTSSNANSKKRAKSRKAGLQALLDQSRSRASQPGLGLSLVDFMQK
ncbi:hypothetical protein N657DRAFT_579165 [Parathielavia appendiculata]|uniref:Uncharacterized protein n=1 Tax=Parathielavia appendiculata TaxID=2587402 RepID=A0AAN6TVT7_9PEZI|nr:hypothetical protein N657DRAFT_579165 [Parathielavia appendiculata]